MVKAAHTPELLAQIRPAWQARDLIKRVHTLIQVDPSSACQRIFNAAMHDLREKVVLVGIDLARDAAKRHKLPPIESIENIDEYSVAKLIDLSYRMGLISHPEWRRLLRVYEIRRDLEHEDDQYEASVEDVIYVFKTCVEVVLSKDPISLLRVNEVKEVIEQPNPITANQSLLSDYEHAPQPRQVEIMSFLIDTALDTSKPDIVRSNAFHLLQELRPITHSQVILQIGTNFQNKIGRTALEQGMARVAHACGAFPYLTQAQRTGYFEARMKELDEIGYGWRGNLRHGEALRTILEVGGLSHTPTVIRQRMLKYLVLVYIGEKGPYGNRLVWFSNSGAPLAEQLIKEASSYSDVNDYIKTLREDPQIKRLCQDEHVARRYEELLDIADPANPQ